MTRPTITGVAAAAAVFVAATPASPALADDGLTRAQTSRVQRAALQELRGTAIDIDRDNADDGTVTFSAKILTRFGAVREIEMNRRYRVTRRKRDERPEGLTYRRALRAKSAARKRIKGIVTSVDTEDEGRTRYELDVLRRDTAEYQVRLDRSFKVLGARRKPNND